MKKLLLLLLLLPALHNAQAQVKTRLLKKVMELKMPQTAEDEMPGTRGASVAWHPIQKKYYAAMAGNSAYPLAVFNATGKRLSDDDAACLMDVRGLWYNAAKKAINGNGYAENGWFVYNADAKGMVTGYDYLFDGQNQPGDQAVGALNSAKNCVQFLSGATVFYYGVADAAAKDSVMLHFGRTAKQGDAGDENAAVTPEDYNSTAVIYSGVAKAELGVLNVTEKQVELYNAKTGFLSQTLKLPADAPVDVSFNFSFANGIYWLFDQEARVWKGYK
jgi:hypothetical protein